MMSTGERRRSARISELDARRAQQVKSQNKDKGTCEVEIEDLGTVEGNANIKRGRKKVKIRSVKDLVSDEYQFQKVGNSSGEDHHTNSAVMSPGTPLPAKSKLELFLGNLKRKDSYEIFAEPVNPDEVKDYYDTIKEPMDFGTISRKLNVGSYKTLEEFERDVLLVSSNAMVFNPSNTIYYRQAHAIRDLAKKLFDALKSDPENLENEFSVTRLPAARRTKTAVQNLNSGSCDQSASRRASKGCREERRYQYLEEDQRGTFRPWNSFQTENESIVSSVYKSSQPIIPVFQPKLDSIGYKESLLKFVKDLGPMAQNVAGKKLQRCTAAEAFNCQTATIHCELQTRKYGMPNEMSGQKGNSAVISLDLCKNSTRSQKGKMDNLGDKWNVQKASTFGTLDIVASNHAENNFSHSGKAVQAIVEGGVSFKRGMVANQGIGSPYFSSTWNNACGNFNNFISNSINKGKNVQMTETSSSSSKETPGNKKRKLVEAMKEGDTFSKENTPYQDNRTPYFSTSWNTGSNKVNFVLSSINKDMNFQRAGVTSSHAVQNPGAGHSYLFMAGNTHSNSKIFIPNARNNPMNVQMAAVNPNNLIQNPGDFLRIPVENMRQGGPIFKDTMANQGNGSAYVSTPVLLPVPWNTGSNPDKLMPTPVNTGLNVQVPVMTFSGPRMQGTLSASNHNGALPSVPLEWLSPPRIESIWNQADPRQGFDFNLTSGVSQLQSVGDGRCTSYGVRLEQAGQTWTWLKPVAQLLPQAPVFVSSMQEQSITTQVDLSAQAGSSQLGGWGNSAANGRRSILGHPNGASTRAPLFNNYWLNGR